MPPLTPALSPGYRGEGGMQSPRLTLQARPRVGRTGVLTTGTWPDVSVFRRLFIMPDLNRRNFLATATAAVAAATCACALDCPFALAADAAAEDTGPVDIGTPADYPKDGPYDKFTKKPTSLLVVRDGGKLFAPTAICTHKKANLAVDGGEIVCPKHDSPFDNQGVPK